MEGEYPEEKASTALDPTLKDLNWIKRGRELELGPEKGALFEEQLRRDTEMLKSVKVMDYSLLIGIYKMERDNRDTHLSRRGTMYKVFCKSSRWMFVHLRLLTKLFFLS